MRLLAPFVAVVSLTTCSYNVPSEPPDSGTRYCSFEGTGTWGDLAIRVGSLATRETPPEGYDRSKWKRWHDFDRDCQDTRAEILIEEARYVSFTDPSKACLVSKGSWKCPYTLENYYTASDLDIDHVVSLPTMYEIVGHNPKDKFEAIDIELGFIENGNLLAVQADANQSKGSRGPAQWLPEPHSARCPFVRKFAHLATNYSSCYGDNPAFTEAEIATMVHQLHLCEDGGIPAAPQVNGSEDIPPPSEPDAQCCKMCVAGLVCGDGCIARSKICAQPLGCACQGVEF